MTTLQLSNRMTAKLIILTLFLAAVKAYLPSCQDANDSVICKLTEKYEKSLPCEPYPLNLTQIITVHDVVNMNAKEQTITVFLQLMSIWNDTRITAKLNGSDWIIVDEKVAKDVYFPKMTFLRSKSTKELEIFGPNYPYFWMMLPHHLEYRELLKVEFFCDFDFSQYPFDQHECKLIFGSNFLSNFYVNLVPTIVKSSDGKQTLPGQKPIEVVNTNLPFKIHLESMQSFLSENIGFNYTHSWIKISFQRRHFSTLSGQFYIPVSVFISFSLISYSINPEMVSKLAKETFSCILKHFG